MTGVRFATACAVTLLVLAGCTAGTSGHGQAAEQSRTPAACPASYLPPDPQRPSVSLTFAVSADLSTVRGTEHLTFTPDRPVTELVFRLTANTRPTVAAGNRIAVTSARADHGAGAPTYSAADADPSTQGGLLRIPFGRPLSAGTRVTADLAFTLTLGSESFDRFGRAQGYGWFASAHPLLAWEPGFGWHTEPMLQFAAESATSEAMRTDLSVTAQASQTVIMSGGPQSATPASGGTRTWRAAIDSALAVGPFSIRDMSVGGVALRVGAATAQVADRLTPQFVRAITELASRFGPFPYRSLSVARLPLSGGGIEYPSAILMFDDSQLVAVHETAHQWFYGMVGNSQATHPWLDEAFASYAEQLVDDDAPPVRAVNEPGRVDSPAADYGSDERGYFAVTYRKGAAALHAARAAAGAQSFDRAVRCYLNANAWRIAEPADLADVLQGLPAARAVLRKAQALP